MQISEKYFNEFPWHAAQVEARSIVTFETPQGKIDAVLRCCKTIMYLLKMADQMNCPGADDFMPVLVYVLVMVRSVVVVVVAAGGVNTQALSHTKLLLQW